MLVLECDYYFPRDESVPTELNFVYTGVSVFRSTISPRFGGYSVSRDTLRSVVVTYSVKLRCIYV